MLCPATEAWHLGGFHTAARYSRLQLMQVTGFLTGVFGRAFAANALALIDGHVDMSSERSLMSHRRFGAQGTAVV
jgi:hypothetical protein